MKMNVNIFVAPYGCFDSIDYRFLLSVAASDGAAG